MSDLLYIVLAGVVGYIFGAIPFGFLFVLATKKVDLREVGSGRTGGTNSFRAAGLTVGILTAVSDALKGAGAVWIAWGLFGSVLDENALAWAAVASGVFAVVGHNWSIFLGWRGGAGTGPNVGWAAAIWWGFFPLGILVVGGLLWGVGIASVASLSMGLVLVVGFAIRYLIGVDGTLAYLVGSIFTFLVVAWSLRPNIRRLLAGEERVVGPRARRLKRQQEAE